MITKLRHTARLGINYIGLALRYLRFCLHILAFSISKNKAVIKQDLDHWHEIIRPHEKSCSYASFMTFLFVDRQEFRNLFYYRINEMFGLRWILKKIAVPLPTLYLWTPSIGGGLFIQHGFATVLCAKSIGEHCFINQQVTVGHKGNQKPVIGNNVKITCGAKVLGGVKVGDNSTIGANAVVVRDVPANVVAIGIPARILRHNDDVIPN